ncbi:hypothetical protein G3T14_14670 [Methylobacterium sp. BTF04]|uniref:hypothetical protein n=1 Tax=Methylobacterium sp. BTF04 TaxID=2708300 RepID=UPI0013D67498|nr:hypothetical protein [Methylobacterium sp. BTF04]NEU13364.1 hypothetical protein [Methylobacterium sp. BTF04]
MVDETVSRIPAASPVRWGSVRALLGPVAIAGLATGFVWAAPERNAWAAAALALALVLDGVARAAGARAARRGRPAPRLGGPPSVVFAMRPGLGLGAALFGVALFLWPAGFALLASALAGLIAMGAIARLALVRIVLATPDEPEA